MPKPTQPAARRRPPAAEAETWHARIGNPARRALAAAGISDLATLARYSEAELLKLHGLGPKAIAIIKTALAEAGLKFAAPTASARVGAEANARLPRRAAAPPAAPAVAALLAQLQPSHRAEVEAVRAILLSVDKRVQEAVKWNAPSYHLAEHFATFKLHPAPTVQVVLHTGAKAKPKRTAVEITDPSGLLRWAEMDRAVITFSGLRDIAAKRAAFRRILKQWIAQL